MYTRDKSIRTLGLVITTAMAGALLSGCAAADVSGVNLATNQAQQAEKASADGKVERAITLAESAVSSDPRNAAHRAQLGSKYLDAGRFASAATSFDDAIKLGDTSARTALSGALALTGEGKLAQAASLLNSNEGKIAKADLGLAVSLAGQPERGIHIMSNAIRGGENTVKMRQNLAYAYALAGRWREARLMTEQDVPAGMVSDRIGAWAETVHPQAFQYRIAKLLQVPATVIDAGQPAQLALGIAPEAAPVALAVAAPKTMRTNANAELPALAVKANDAPYKVKPKADNFEDAFVASQPRATKPLAAMNKTAATKALVAKRYAELPAQAKKPAPLKVAKAAPTIAKKAPAKVAKAPAKIAKAAPKPRAATTHMANKSGSHLVQLGSFASEARARKAWDIYTARYPELKNHKMVISQAKVHGKNFWRVSAGNFAKADSSKMCSKVKASGKGCLTWAASSPLPGAIRTGVRLARR